MPRSVLEHRLRHLLHPVYRRLETIVHPLRYLFLEITQKCNLNCLHCGSDCDKNPKQGELTIDEWIDFIDYLGRVYPKKNDLMLVITGGEPLCHPGIFKILKHIRQNSFNYGIVTNGYLLSAKNVDLLVEHQIRSITVSLDGLRDTHDWLRGLNGSFDKAYAGIKLLAKTSIPFFDVVTCVNPRNLTELQDIFDLLTTAGVKNWRLFNIFPKGRAAANEGLILAPEQIHTMFAWIRATRIKLEGTDFCLDFACEGYLPKKMDREVRSEPYFCRAGISIGSVLCDGSISACPNISHDFIQGNIRTGDFASIWENKFELYRNRQWMKQGQCAHCCEWQRCQGNSMHLWDTHKNQSLLCYHSLLEKT